jgi:hypothetical protein
MAIDIIIESQVSQTITDGVTSKAPSENTVFDALATKVDKETGKGLSEEDFTMAEKNKLAGIEANAQVNVNADWNATTGDAEILNKPTIPDVALLVPYTGAVADVDLGTHKLTAKDLVVNHPSGSGDAATITKGGSGEALKVVKSSGSGNAASITGGVTLLSELDLQTPLADAEIASAATWNSKIGGAVAIGQVAFGTAAGVIGGDAGLTWDNVNKRLGVGTNAPTARLHVQASGALSTDIAFRVRNSADTLDIIRAQGDGSVFIGLGAGNVNTGANNTANGFQALFSNTTGANNTANGFQALRNNRTGNDNTTNGFQALFSNTTGSVNTAFGFQALFSNTTGNDNTANGVQALFSNTTGTNNTANGFQALRNNTTGNDNTTNGFQALFSNTTGGSNTANGVNALLNNTTGGSNTANGVNAGRFIADGTTANTITNNSVFLGGGTRAQDNNQTNQIVIGHNAIGNGSNTVTLGNTSIIKTILRGTLNAANLPTSATGLVAGDIWNDAGTLKIV